tara:strand:- start:326 stop:901 length:576 start_codon:yes stop_codon:yes gene_type:complete
MKNYVGKKINTAIFISGNGSNMKNLIRFSYEKQSPIIVKLVISSNKNAKGLVFASKKKINNYFYNFVNLKVAEKKILKIMNEKNIKLICLAGFMRILSSKFIKNFKGIILNIHPSLLPKYKGLNTHKRVLENGEKFSGCTVHLVNSKLDAGKIIMQKKIKTFKKDTALKLKKRVQKEEYKLYPRAIKKIIN